MSQRVPQQSLTPSGLAWTWWRGDPLPPLDPLPGLTIERAQADATLAQVNRVPRSEVLSRVWAGHRPYVARADGQPVAYGWVATRTAEFADGRCRFRIPSSERYLWDFATLPAWRGRGIYPRLLQAILLAEAGGTERFWILHEWSNEASKRGIARAGFQAVAIIYDRPNGGLGIGAFEGSDRAGACIQLLGLPPVDGEARSPDDRQAD